MRVLVIDAMGNGLDFSMRAQRDGHDVKHFIPDTEKTKFIGENLVPIIRDFDPFIEWADIIFLTDNTKYLRQLDSYRDHKPIIGPTKETAEWELDRVKGMQVLKDHGIPCPDYKEFNNYDDAIRYVKKESRAFVSKPSGDADKSLSYVAKNPVDLVYMLERWKSISKLKSPFILQEKIEGIEMAVGGWFGPHGWNSGWCENFEFKKLMTGDMGVNTGEQGTVLRFVTSSKLAQYVLTPLTKTLLNEGYIGYVDVNCIIDEKGKPWPLEFTMRPGWPTFNIQNALHEGDVVEWLADLCEGKDTKNFTMDRVAIGVVLSVPDYPYSHLTRKEVVGIPIYGIPPNLWEHIHPCEMMMADRPNKPDGSSKHITTMPMPCTGGDYVLVMTAVADTVKLARSVVHYRLNKLIVPNSPMWRTDIGLRLAKELPNLHKMGYATEMEF